ncbi:energy transducer TonB [Sediminibacterium soli]|uniref:energy transducer TonB n=1 Tax=Sediminibacterium soli TaxID=2698829 RepID=UPI00137AB7AF|nr:hypothetical protein [Sediminibacterium soli]NCI47494.1 hypothetical protein [Sediminibacterium soli]
MKKSILLLCFACSVAVTTLQAQTPADSITVVSNPEKKAEFKGGVNGWIRFLESTLDRNLLEKNNAPSGSYRVIGNFIVDRDGSVKDIRIEEDPGYGAADEYKRVLLLSSKKWIPASDKGIAVAYRHKQSLTLIR